MARITTPELAQAFIDEQVRLVREQVKDGKVLLALSGGVDSSVVAALLIKAIGSNLVCVHVNHGFLRKGEPEQVIQVFQKELGANLIYVDAVDRFLDKVAGVTDPEQKRHIIGEEFIKVFDEEAAKLTDVHFLGQGTIYPDIRQFNVAECILDFSEVSFVDSSGIAVVINSMRRMAQIEGELFLAGLGEQPRKVFRTSGIDRLVHIKEAV